jgi:hypothetical protein
MIQNNKFKKRKTPKGNKNQRTKNLLGRRRINVNN